jgi:hypothetical protein
LTLDPKQRAGFLTSASMLVQTAAPSQAATVIHRGLLVRERVLCETPPPPPPDVQRDPAAIQAGGDNATARENYELFKMQKPTCNACHSFFQPLGLAFESYDAAGKFRSTYRSATRATPTARTSMWSTWPRSSAAAKSVNTASPSSSRSSRSVDR